MIGTIQNPKSNVKKEYSTANGQFFVHAVTVDGIEYESHQKTNTNKFKGGEVVEYEVKQDTKGNKKVTTKPVENVNPNNVRASSPTTPGQNSGRGTVWLDIFRSICILRAGSGKSLGDIVNETDSLI